VTKLDYSVQISKDDGVQVCLTAMVSGQPTKDIQDIKAPIISRDVSVRSSIAALPNIIRPALAMGASQSSVSSNQDELVHELEEGDDFDGGMSAAELEEGGATPLPLRKSQQASHSNNPILKIAGRADSVSSRRFQVSRSSISTNEVFVEITPLSTLPFAKITQFTGRISLHFIKETHLTLETSPMNGMGGYLLLI
jgi:hypothetical protein